MNSLEILNALLLIPRHTVGVFPADRIVEKWVKPCAFVFNTDNHSRPGPHWLAIYVDKNSNGWFFDSYGRKPYIREHLRVIRKNCRLVRWNTIQLQSLESSKCGHFCVMFLHFLASGKTMSQFLNIFSGDLRDNDRISASFVKKICKKTGHSKRLYTGSGIPHRDTPTMSRFAPLYSLQCCSRHWSEWIVSCAACTP